jgi:hypothetical protein
MKHKIHELEGRLLDEAVAKAVNDPRVSMWGSPWIDDGVNYDQGPRGRGYRPSTDPCDGWPIIEREHISVISDDRHMWLAVAATEISASGGRDEESGFASAIYVTILGRSHKGATALIAAMRAYVASKFGDDVELS